MTAPNVPESVLERIKKLHHHAESARAIDSVDEARVFSARVQEMLIEYELEIEQVLAASDANRIDGERVEGVPKREERSRWEMVLAEAVAESNGCFPLYAMKGNGVWFVGKKQNRAVACYLFRMLIRFAEEEVALALAQRNQQPTSHVEDVNFGGLVLTMFYDGSFGIKDRTSPEDFRANWLEGFAIGIFRRLEAARDAMRDEAAAPGGSGERNQHGLVLLNNASREAEAAVEKMFNQMGEQEYPKAPPVADRTAFHAGQARAMDAPLSADALGESSTTPQIEPSASGVRPS